MSHRPPKLLNIMLAFGSIALAWNLFVDTCSRGGQLPCTQPATATEHQGRLASDLQLANATGGRARGGSFSRPNAPSAPPPNYPSGPSTFPTSPDYNYGPRRSYPPTYYPYPHTGPVVVPVPGPGYVPAPTVSTGPSLDIGFIFLLLVLGFGVLPTILSYLKLGPTRAGGAGSGGELSNDVVTVTRLQVALLAQARQIQTDLTNLTLRVNTATQEGLTELLRETVLALLRSPESWTHARVSSQTVRSREQASQLFEQLSIEERSKFTAETLVNVGGKIDRRHRPATPDDAPASYIVVTLLLGTADDRPLVGTVNSPQELRAALQRLGAVPSNYLLVYELLWSPQDETDSLSEDELIVGYPDLVRIG